MNETAHRHTSLGAHLCAVVFLLTPVLLRAQHGVAHDRPAPTLLWSSQVGKTTFRTEIAHLGDRLYVGSNGQRYKDFIGDSDNGVHILHARTGQRERSIVGGSWGDNDVNGTLALNGRIYFGSDNDEFFCVSDVGDLIWRVPCSGDVEHVPVALPLPSGQTAVVYATERGEVRALNPDDGSTLWTHYQAGFDGWKPGENRFVFRVQNHLTDASGYFTAPNVEDVNEDGTLDLVYTTGQGTEAISGADGSTLWKNKLGAYFSPRPALRRMRRSFETLDYEWVQLPGEGEGYNWAFRYRVMDHHGKALRTFPGLLNTRLDGYCVREGDGALLFLDGHGGVFEWLPGLKFPLPIDRKSKRKNASSEPDPLQYSTSFMATTTLKLDEKDVLVLVVERRYRTWEDAQSVVELRDASTGHILSEFILPERSESTPMFADVNRDGTPEILVGDDSGNLYCIQP